MKTKYISKWGLLNINKEKLKGIYERNRIKAYSILKNRHKKEYSIILNTLQFKEYNKRLRKYENKY